jgi:hypothetical protein
MAEPEPRYVMTFRARRPETIVVATLTFFGAVFAVWVAAFLREFECTAEAWSQCSAAGLVQLLVAVGGLIAAVAMLVESLRNRGHPWRWFCVTALVFAGWGLVVTDWVSG